MSSIGVKRSHSDDDNDDNFSGHSNAASNDNDDNHGNANKALVNKKKKKGKKAKANGEDDFRDGASPDPIDDKGPNSSIPIFLKKTYRLIESCDPAICSWTEDGEMFVVKDPELFASTIIPQYFDHNKFSSFARQLNFYGFRKIQTKPIRNADFDEKTARHVTFFNEKFKRGRYDLLKEIQRSTRGGGSHATIQDQAKEMESLRSTVLSLEQKVHELECKLDEQDSKAENRILAKVEVLIKEWLSTKPYAAGSLARGTSAGASTFSHYQAAAAVAGLNGGGLATAGAAVSALPPYGRSFGSIGLAHAAGTGSGLERGVSTASGWENPILLGSQAARAFSTASASSLLGAGGNSGDRDRNGNDRAEAGVDNIKAAGTANGGENASAPAAQPPLPPHPKQKSLPPLPAINGIPQQVTSKDNAHDELTASAALGTLSAIREASMGRTGLRSGLGGMNPSQLAAVRGLSTASNTSMMFRNAFEDKFFTTLMMENASRNQSLAGGNGYGSMGGLGMNGAGGYGGMGMTGGAGGGGIGNASGLAALAAAQQQHHHQQQAGYAAYLQDRANAMMLNAGAGGGGGGGGNYGNYSGNDNQNLSLKRQSTAEVLLEAAGELGQGGNGSGHASRDNRGGRAS
ncbi:hypothetical protein ACHAXS_006123 [Conticribra weissflogii]